jgi:hypothetical protein
MSRWGEIKVLKRKSPPPKPRGEAHTLDELEASEEDARALLTRAARQASAIAIASLLKTNRF